MKMLFKERLSPNKYKTPEGYLVCVDAVLARTGKQTYLSDELFNDGSYDKIEVDRPEKEVFSEKTLSSFENKPITLDHPDVEVNSQNHRDYSVGFVRDVKQGISEGQKVIMGTLVFTDQQVIEKIENNEYKELSCGYDCDIKDDNGYYQHCIRGNHVALCKEGRAGIAKIIDSKVNDNFTFKLTKKKNDYDEYVVQAYKNGKKNEDATYYTDDWEDALGTLKSMAKQHNLTYRQQGSVHIVDNKLNDLIVNGNLETYDINTFIKHVQEKQSNLHTNLKAKNGDIYSIMVYPSSSNLDTGQGVRLDITREDTNGKETDVLYKKLSSWNDLKNIFNDLKRGKYEKEDKMDINKLLNLVNVVKKVGDTQIKDKVSLKRGDWFAFKEGENERFTNVNTKFDFKIYKIIDVRPDDVVVYDEYSIPSDKLENVNNIVLIGKHKTYFSGKRLQQRIQLFTNSREAFKWLKQKTLTSFHHQKLRKEANLGRFRNDSNINDAVALVRGDWFTLKKPPRSLFQNVAYIYKVKNISNRDSKLVDVLVDVYAYNIREDKIYMDYRNMTLTNSFIQPQVQLFTNSQEAMKWLKQKSRVLNQ